MLSKDCSTHKARRRIRLLRLHYLCPCGLSYQGQARRSFKSRDVERSTFAPSLIDSPTRFQHTIRYSIFPQGREANFTAALVALENRSNLQIYRWQHPDFRDTISAQNRI